MRPSRRVPSGTRGERRPSALLGLVILNGGVLFAATEKSSAVLVAARAVQASPPEAADSVVAPPPLLLPGVFDPSRGPLSQLSLAEVYSRIREEIGPIAGGIQASSPPADRDARLQALKQYVEGKAANLDGKTLVAISKLEAALALDPGSPEILGELARAYARAGNQQKSASLYQRLLDTDPSRPEALLSLGLQAANRGESRRAVVSLAPLLLLGTEARRNAFAGFRPEAENAVELSVARALKELDADAALVEVLSSSVRRSQQGVEPWQLAETFVTLGDAQARLDRIADAVISWDGAPAARGAAISMPLLARRVWGRLAIGRSGQAFDLLQPIVLNTESLPSDELITLVGWVAAVAPGSTQFNDWAAASLDRNQDHHPSLVRLAAALNPKDARAILLDGLDRSNPDAQVLRALLFEAARASPAEAVTVAVSLLEVCATDPEALIDAVIRCGLDAPTLLDASGAVPETPTSIAFRMRLATTFGRTGEAWELGSKTGPAAGRAILRALVFTAGEAEEGALLYDLARQAEANDAATQLELARAWRRCGDGPRASDAARAADAAAGTSRSIRARAQTLNAQALADIAARRGSADALRDALASARNAVAVDHTFQPAWRLLLGLADARAQGASATADDKATAAQLRREAIEADPQGTLANQLAVERLFSVGRGADALDMLFARAASDLTEPDLLRTVVRTLIAGNRRGEALLVLDARIAATPADASVWQLWTETTIADGHPNEALERLMARSEQPIHDPVAFPLLELPLRALNRTADADVVATALLALKPPSPRRDLTQGAQFIAMDNGAQAVPILEGLAERLDSLSLRDVFAALELAIRLPADGDARSRLTIRFGDAIVERTSPGGSDAQGIDPAVILRAAVLVTLESPGPEGAARRRALAERAASAAMGAPSGVTSRDAQAWQAAGQYFADARRYADGAEFVATLVRADDRMDIMTATRLASIAFALDAAAGARAEHSIALLELVRARGGRPFAKESTPTEREPDALYQLAGLFAMIGDREGANVILTRGLEVDPSHPSCLNNLAWDRLEHGESGPDVAGMLEKAHAARPGDAAILDSIGWLRYKQGAFDEAIAFLREAIKLGGTNPGVEPIDHLGDALWRKGDSEGARNAWRDVRRTADREYPRDTMLRVLGNHQRSEYGVEVIDGPTWWERNYGRVIDRAERKLQQSEKGDPEIAPIAAPST